MARTPNNPWGAHPVTGRFIQRDPVWDPVNVGNPYTFVGNNPATGRDPSGLAGSQSETMMAGGGTAWDQLRAGHPLDALWTGVKTGFDAATQSTMIGTMPNPLGMLRAGYGQVHALVTGQWSFSATDLIPGYHSLDNAARAWTSGETGGKIAAAFYVADFFEEALGAYAGARVALPRAGTASPAAGQFFAQAAPARSTFWELLPRGGAPGQRVAPKHVLQELLKTEAGRGALERIRQFQPDVWFDYSRLHSRTLMGLTEGNEIQIFIRNTQSVRQTAGVVVHEATHLGGFGGSLRAEAIAEINRFRHLAGRTPTRPEVRRLINQLKNSPAYADYNWRIHAPRAGGF